MYIQYAFSLSGLRFLRHLGLLATGPNCSHLTATRPDQLEPTSLWFLLHRQYRKFNYRTRAAMEKIIPHLEALAACPPTDVVEKRRLHDACRKLSAATENHHDTICRVTGSVSNLIHFFIRYEFRLARHVIGTDS